MERLKACAGLNLAAITYITFAIMIYACVLFHHPVMAQVASSSSSSIIKNQSTYFSLDSIFEAVDNSVVMITSKVSNNLQNPQTQNATELGSGFIYDMQGHIVTASHVIDESKLVDVTFVDGSRYTAKNIGRDLYSDIAVLQIIGSTIQPLKPLIIENSSGLRAGQQ